MNDVENLDKQQGVTIFEKKKNFIPPVLTHRTPEDSAFSNIKIALISFLENNPSAATKNKSNFHEWDEDDQTFNPPLKPGHYLWYIDDDGTAIFYKNNRDLSIKRIISSTEKVYFVNEQTGFDLFPETIQYNSNNLEQQNDTLSLVNDIFNAEFNLIQDLINKTTCPSHQDDLLAIYTALTNLTKPS